MFIAVFAEAAGAPVTADTTVEATAAPLATPVTFKNPRRSVLPIPSLVESTAASFLLFRTICPPRVLLDRATVSFCQQFAVYGERNHRLFGRFSQEFGL